MKKNIYISVSTDPVKEYQKVFDYVSFIQNKADMLHCDIMDGKFVERTTYDSNLLASINSNSLIMLDVHLMIKQPEAYYQDYIDAGANILTIHYEAVKDKELLIKIIKDIQSKKVLAGLAICPGTELKDIKHFLYDVDIVLVMSVDPGQSGQKFEQSSITKIKQIDKFRADNNLQFKIEVDGGINDVNAKKLINAGADILVSGSFVYNSADRLAAIDKLKNI